MTGLAMGLSQAAVAAVAILLSSGPASAASTAPAPGFLPGPLAATFTVDGESILANLITWGIIGAITTLVSSLVTVRVLKASRASDRERIDGLEKRTNSDSRDLADLRLACARCPASYVHKDDLSAVSEALGRNQERTLARLDEIDKADETRVHAVHDRLNEMARQLHVLTGKLEEHLRGGH